MRRVKFNDDERDLNKKNSNDMIDFDIAGTSETDFLLRKSSKEDMAQNPYNSTSNIYDNNVGGNNKIKVFYGIKLLLNYSIAGGLMLGLEGWAFQATLFFAGRIGAIELDAQQCIYSIMSTTYISVSFGFAVVGSIRVANLLGAGKPSEAR